jgi:hypothetical protein
MEATVAGRGSGAARGRGRGAAARAVPVPPAELRRVLGDALEAAEADDKASTLIRAAGPRLRIEVTDASLVLNLAPSDEHGRTLRWRFDDKVDWEPRLRIWMDSATANRYLQGRESLAIAIARGRVRAEGDARTALLYLPAMRFLIEPYRRLIRERFPDLEVD